MPTVRATPEQIKEIEDRIAAGLPPFPDMVKTAISDGADAVKRELGRISEDDFMQQIIELAHIRGWKVAHFRPGLTKGGKWVTPVQADGAGFTDLVLVRERVVWAEIKSETDILSATQKLWCGWLVGAGQEWYCWYPKDWETIQAVLR